MECLHIINSYISINETMINITQQGLMDILSSLKSHDKNITDEFIDEMNTNIEKNKKELKEVLEGPSNDTTK